MSAAQQAATAPVASQSGSRLSFKTRNRHFAAGNERHWYNGDPVITAYFNALSAMFPDGERFFCDTVRKQKHKIGDPKLQDEIREFLGQEAIHSREHQLYNDRIAELGYPMRKIEARSARMLALAKKVLPPRAQLGQTVALEHFTAILADQLLTDREIFRDQATPEEYELWMWHAVEETEHKAVAFDVLKAVSSKPAFYLNRVRALLMTTLFFNANLFMHIRDLLKTDGLHWSPRAWGRLFAYLWVRPGSLRKAIPAYLDWFRPGFHPWDHDNRDLVAAWKQEHNEAQIAASAA
ncbi:metal-dependent hydrolase-like protein [Parvibaculum lavamentivorans DS-1]|uniref:Metal-dependent hydrolase-like protein n=1 Tax=Parvibaculum lavamentivorans (strain DS-1 / DSM 13023 / NCIMB 13966) TaxID=402881 RepID=A7HUG2_PARL1|nr:metal-dependent hydrolase [Parvibaculum lavamentivorans]ABS63545.1 metal-dependent hydrolase-like protein [Parvibaculum lavamentivorans DS-1]